MLHQACRHSQTATRTSAAAFRGSSAELGFDKLSAPIDQIRVDRGRPIANLPPAVHIDARLPAFGESRRS
jgi:hypothetical protein